MPYVSMSYGSYDGLFDSLKSLAQSVIPAHTVGGKLLAGNVSGATKDAVALVTKPSAPTATAQPLPESYGAGMMAPGGFFERNQTVLILGAGALALFLVMGRRRGGRR